MAQGLQVFDKQGKCTFDTNYSTCRFMGKLELKNKEGSFFPKLENGNKCWCIAYTDSGNAYINLQVTPTGIKWTDYNVYSDDETVKIIYGSY